MKNKMTHINDVFILMILFVVKSTFGSIVTYENIVKHNNM